MIIEIVMPKMGESITEGTILEWRKKVGEFVEKDELFLEIGTDKVDSEIPCRGFQNQLYPYRFQEIIHLFQQTLLLFFSTQE